MYGLLRDVGASLQFDDCNLNPDEGFLDHKCSIAEDLEEFNCKRSKFETTVSVIMFLTNNDTKTISTMKRILFA